MTTIPKPSGYDAAIRQDYSEVRPFLRRQARKRDRNRRHARERVAMSWVTDRSKLWDAWAERIALMERMGLR